MENGLIKSNTKGYFGVTSGVTEGLQNEKSGPTDLLKQRIEHLEEKLHLNNTLVERLDKQIEELKTDKKELSATNNYLLNNGLYYRTQVERQKQQLEDKDKHIKQLVSGVNTNNNQDIKSSLKSDLHNQDFYKKEPKNDVKNKESFATKLRQFFK
ncbi:MAG: hypothetical protein QM571_07545 [Micrococcaceae bacterium]